MKAVFATVLQPSIKKIVEHFSETRLPNQKLMQCFQFAIRHGYCQLVQYIWDKIGDNTKEYIGWLMCIAWYKKIFSICLAKPQMFQPRRRKLLSILVV